MSTESKARGTLTFDSEDTVEELLDQLSEDDELEEHIEGLRAQMKQHGARLTLDLYVDLPNEANLWLQEWLSDLVAGASEGYLDTWQEGFGDSMFVRLSASSDDEEEIHEPFPP